MASTVKIRKDQHIWAYNADIKPGPQGAGMVFPQWGQLIDKAMSPQTRIFQVKDGMITMESNGVTFPTRPNAF